jgi:hypothetical protein
MVVWCGGEVGWGGGPGGGLGGEMEKPSETSCRTKPVGPLGTLG